ncbi:MAG: HEPN domain-containing protein [Desulfurococcaceae archaeon]
MVSRYRDWLRQAERNLLSAQVNFREGLYEESCYESHQAAEKAFKALLNYLHKERRGHSITFLAAEVDIPIPSEIRDCATQLDKHYIPSRYPDVYDEGSPADYYTIKDASSCISCAEKVLKWVMEVVERTS